jgi:uncharacterized membrane protein YecN with MAPEG domain
MNEGDLAMSIPVLVLLAFGGWTLLTLFGSIGVYRWRRILTGRASIAEWRADVPQGSEWYQRAMRAHMNCIENLPIYTAVVVALMATGMQSSVIDRLAIALISARIAQRFVGPNHRVARRSDSKRNRVNRLSRLILDEQGGIPRTIAVVF